MKKTFFFLAALCYVTGVTAQTVPAVPSDSSKCIFYTATKKCAINYLNYVAHDYDPVTQKGWIQLSDNATDISWRSFENNTSLLSLSSPTQITSISGSAFEGCSNLTAIDLPNCTSIGHSAFYECSSLTAIDLPNCVSIDVSAFWDCSSLTTIDLPLCTSIKSQAFYNCSSLTAINVPNCASIGSEAFDGCINLPAIDLPNCTSIDDYAFLNCWSLYHVTLGETIPTIGEYALYQYIRGATIPIVGDYTFISVARPISCSFLVPTNKVAAYRAAPLWSDMSSRIIDKDAQHDYTLDGIVASDQTSAILTEIGEDNTVNVMNLSVSGSINSYDILVIRNKMPNLHFLDLQDASIVASDYPYYSTYTTQNDTVGDNMFYQLNNLVSVVLPASCKHIGVSALRDCSIKEIDIPAGVKRIDDEAFEECYNLQSVTFHEGLNYIGDSAFNKCYDLQSVVFHKGLNHIGDYAFNGCPLETISLSNTLQEIGVGAFCFMQTDSIVLPSSLKKIGSGAFPHLRKVYAAVVDPFQISDQTFDAPANTTLYVPMTDEWKATFYKYYWDTQWGRFLSIEGWAPTYKDFYIDSDYHLDEGTIPGEGEQNPDAEFSAGSGFIVEDDGHQELAEGSLDVQEESQGGSGSLIGGKDGEENLTIGTLTCNISIQQGKWYFFAFPANVNMDEITCKRTDDPDKDARYVFRYYDAAERAADNQGIGSHWKNIQPDATVLEKGLGYIFQANKNSTLTIVIHDFKANEQSARELEEQPSSNPENAGWNFVGNPFISYYEINDIHDFDAPVTVWNGSGYEALSPEDDDYTFTPFQAFFVQKPDGTQSVGFDPAGQETRTQSQETARQNIAARKAAAKINPERLLINMTLSDGTYTDKTRVVYNDSRSMDYEVACDASKFFSTEAVPQLYTVYRNTNYAINERPMNTGDFQLGYVAPKQGEYTLAAVRMDVPVMLYDAVAQVTHDLSLGDYTFTSGEGTFDNRFVVSVNSAATGLLTIYQQTGVSIMPNGSGLTITGLNDHTVSVYSVSGQQVTSACTDGMINLSTGTYLVKIGELTSKVMVR